MDSSRSHRARLWFSYAVIYGVWGGVFLAVQIAIREVPIYISAVIRLILAGLLLYGWSAWRGAPRPTLAQVKSAFWIGLLIFVGDYGFLYMAQTRVPSGAACVVMATIPAFTALAEIFLLRRRRMTWLLGLALLVGLGGVGVLANPARQLGGRAIDLLGAGMLLFASMSWSVAAALTQKVTLPESKTMSSGVQMLWGGAMLFVVACVRGELGQFHPAAVSGTAWAAIAYLTFIGSILSFTCYLWLLDNDSPTRVSTYAYVNPVVAVWLGWAWGGEAVGLRAILGMACVLVSVLMITLAKRPACASARPAAKAAD